MKQNCSYSLENIFHSYNDFSLEIGNLNISEGESLGLSGPNGAGKSTLLRILSLQEKPERGTVFCRYGMKEITLLDQSPYLLKRSVQKNISYGLKIRGLSKNIIDERIDEALELVNLDPSVYRKRRHYELSGGQTQRVALAARLALKPSVLLLDEPVSNCDHRSSLIIGDVIRKIRVSGTCTIIISAHDIPWLSGVTDSILSMNYGKIYPN